MLYETAARASEVLALNIDDLDLDARRALGILRQYQTLQAIDLSGLNNRLWDAGVNNRHDRQMVIDSIGFVRKDLQPYGCNIFTWAVDAIQHGRSAEAYGNLIAIHSIGDKLSTFYLRDVALVADIEDSIPAQDYAYFQPVDTWVAQSLGLIERSDRGKIKAIKENLSENASKLRYHHCFSMPERG